jgi:uncharacterized repeat protein (TIGR04076 family)
MDPRQINVIVTEAGRCPLLVAGDSFSVCANEVQVHSGKICMHALHSLHAQLATCLHSSSPLEAASYGPLYCARGFCGTAFRAEIMPIGSIKKAENITETRHQNARRAAIAGAMLQNLGSFMERVPPDVSSKLMRSSTVHTFSKGELILAEGVGNDKLFIVGDGEVCLTRRFPLASEDSFLAVLGVGECFGEMALLTEQINQISVRAHPAATIYSVRKERIDALMNSSAHFNLALCQMLADRSGDDSGGRSGSGAERGPAIGDAGPGSGEGGRAHRLRSGENGRRDTGDEAGGRSFLRIGGMEGRAFQFRNGAR